MKDEYKKDIEESVDWSKVGVPDHRMQFKAKYEDGHPAEFANTMRGQYIISQALYYAIKSLNEVDKEFREVSNINDMQFMRDNLFPLFGDPSDLDERILTLAKLKMESNDED